MITRLETDLKLERFRFLDFNRDSHTSVIETEKRPSFLVMRIFQLKTRSPISREPGFYTK